MSTCRDFKKNGRGRPGLSLPCSICGIEYKNHGNGVVNNPKQDFSPIIVVSIGNTKPKSDKPPVSTEHLLKLFANQSSIEDW